MAAFEKILHIIKYLIINIKQGKILPSVAASCRFLAGGGKARFFVSSPAICGSGCHIDALLFHIVHLKHSPPKYSGTFGCLCTSILHTGRPPLTLPSLKGEAFLKTSLSRILRDLWVLVHKPIAGPFSLSHIAFAEGGSLCKVEKDL